MCVVSIDVYIFRFVTLGSRGSFAATILAFAWLWTIYYEARGLLLGHVSTSITCRVLLDTDNLGPLGHVSDKPHAAYFSYISLQIFDNQGIL